MYKGLYTILITIYIKVNGLNPGVLVVRVV